jgi:glutamate-1-semialdehyde aminotransferase
VTPTPAVRNLRAVTAIDRDRLGALMRRETETYVNAHPRAAEVARQARPVLLGGVPMNWMARWPGPFPIVAAEASGARVTDVDGHTYVDFCLGDTGAMAGHAPAATVAALAAQLPKGLTTMLPSPDAPAVGAELARRFGLGHWQLASSATDANRFALRLARQATGRRLVVVFDWCYHGTVDETLATVDADGRVVPRDGHLGEPVDPALTTRVVPFNDPDALAAALAPGDVAAVLAEPVMTNIGIIHPDPGFHEALRETTRRTGTLLVIDETHTICAGPGGYTRAAGLEPDLLTIGKPIAGGFPTAAYGCTDAVAHAVEKPATAEEGDVSGIGGTLAGNAAALAAIRATLTEVLTDDAFAHMDRLGARWEAGVRQVIDERSLPWSVTRLGARAEYWFLPRRPRHGAEAAAGVDHALDAFMHLYALNRGILLTPFHNMALMCPATSEDDVDRHTEVFAAAAGELLGR